MMYDPIMGRRTFYEVYGISDNYVSEQTGLSVARVREVSSSRYYTDPQTVADSQRVLEAVDKVLEEREFQFAEACRRLILDGFSVNATQRILPISHNPIEQSLTLEIGGIKVSSKGTTRYQALINAEEMMRGTLGFLNSALDNVTNETTQKEAA